MTAMAHRGKEELELECWTFPGPPAPPVAVGSLDASEREEAAAADEDEAAADDELATTESRRVVCTAVKMG